MTKELEKEFYKIFTYRDGNADAIYTLNPHNIVDWIDKNFTPNAPLLDEFPVESRVIKDLSGKIDTLYEIIEKLRDEIKTNLVMRS